MKNTTLKFLSVLFALSFISVMSCKVPENDPRSVHLEADIEKMSNNPAASDSTSNSIKTILSIASHDGFEADKFEYFSDTTATKAIVLVRVPELSSVQKDEREVFLSLIDKMSSKDSWEGKEKYIGLFGKRSLMLCQTPTQSANKSSLPKKMLLDYYGEPEAEGE